MAKTNYITVEVASQRGYTQVKVNGDSDKVLNTMKNAPLLDIMRLRLELMKLTSLCEKVIKEEGNVNV